MPTIAEWGQFWSAAKRGRAQDDYVTDPWNLAQLLGLFGSLASVTTHLLGWNVIAQCCSAVAILLLGTGTLYLIRGLTYTASLAETLTRIFQPQNGFIGAIVMFAIFWLIFVSVFYTLDGYTSFSSAMFGTFKMMIGADDDNHDLGVESWSISFLLHLIFIFMVIVVVIILLNLTISVVSEVWDDISSTIQVIITQEQASLIIEEMDFMNVESLQALEARCTYLHVLELTRKKRLAAQQNKETAGGGGDGGDESGGDGQSGRSGVATVAAAAAKTAKGGSGITVQQGGVPIYSSGTNREITSSSSTSDAQLAGGEAFAVTAVQDLAKRVDKQMAALETRMVEMERRTQAAVSDSRDTIERKLETTQLQTETRFGAIEQRLGEIEQRAEERHAALLLAVQQALTLPASDQHQIPIVFSSDNAEE